MSRVWPPARRLPSRSAFSPGSALCRVGAQQHSGKEALLSGPHRPADAPEVLRTGQRRSRDASTQPYVPGHIVVKFASSVSPQSMSAMAADVGGRATSRLHHADFVLR